MLANDYQRLASRTINPLLDADEEGMHALHGMVGEIGEIHSLFQKTYQGHELDEDHLKKEFGDLLWFIAEFCVSRGWQMGDIMALNIDKLIKRYPDGFTAEESKHRKEGDI